ncbi:PLP-dependent aminotransferase family protein [Pseudonocardia sp. WMMC193]|uniref:MocR-like pyridoxine biosynthesis transcription factor PdxR n=1 Tax=Pseudonocardia sp. WMMC193 TaxID=2911965 RepID=UPI001F4021E7|nr:PLP-dependent aminotransferase family protein [Pseudonocardia sp. WMMC193]MCF7551535.1 PLP-dependent aminotransferase family protein [Pseudonocardia sp. WMMC193]
MTSARNTEVPVDGGPGSARAKAAPAYKALYEQLRTSILTGQLPAGTRLPPSRSLAAETGMSRNTVLAAFEQLQAEGYITGRQGSGTYVASVLPEQVLPPPATEQARPSTSTGRANLSARGRRLAAARRVPLPSVLGRRPHGTAFLIGLPALDAFPFDTWAKLHRERFRKSGPQLMRYDDPAGYRPLREAVAGHISTARGIHCTPDQVIITTGSQQALEFCARILLDPGDPAWLEDPGYLGARAALISAGARIVPVPVDRHGLDVGAGIALEPAARLATVTPSHQFPLGHTMSLERRLALIDWAGDADAWVIEDDYDAEFRYHGKPHAALMAIDTRQRVIYVGTFSKVLFPALRLGYIIAPPDLVDGFLAAHLSTDMHAHLVDQAVVADFIEQGHLTRHLRRMRVLHRERQVELLRCMEPLGEQIRLEPSDGGLHLVGRLPHDHDDRAVAQAALRQGVHVWPLSIHYLGPESRSALLLGYAGTTPTDMSRGVEVLAEALRAG